MPEEMLSPVSFLASFLFQNTLDGELIILTGESGAGKTTACQALIEQARQAGLAVDGLLSPAVFDAGAKIAIDLVAIGSGARRRLAVRRNDGESRPASVPATAGWLFDSGALAWGNDLLRAGLRHMPPVDLLVVDELGPLEILDNQGLTAGLELIGHRQYRLAVVVVRPRLLGAAQERWPWGRVLRVVGSSSP